MGFSTKERAVRMLTVAKHIIEENGWCQGEERKHIGNGMHYCAVGALNEAGKNFSSKQSHESKLLAARALNKAAGPNYDYDIVLLNDSHTTDKRKVLRRYNKAIEILSSK